MTQRNNPDMTGDDQAWSEAPSRGTGNAPATAGDQGTRDPGDRDDVRTRPLGGMEAARRAADDVLELTGCQPDHVVSVAKQDDSWHIGLEVVELHRSDAPTPLFVPRLFAALPLASLTAAPLAAELLTFDPAPLQLEQMP